MHPARLWKPQGDRRVLCRLCSHYCHIEDGSRGKCAVRVNHDGKLYTLVYNRVAAAHLDPVEKKPLFHFLPGTTTFSFGTVGCNLTCTFCQNYALSQPPRQGRPITGQEVTPRDLVDAALSYGAASISYTYSEPTIFFELMADTALAAKEEGLKNIMVTNGFQTPWCLDELAGLIDAANIDLKAYTPAFYEKICGAKLEPVLKNIQRMKALGWWIEVTTLLIPGLNDSDEELGNIARYLAQEVGPEVPWHISRFHPDFKMTDRGPTPLETLEKAWRIGREAGLFHVYVGNVPGNGHSATYCPKCGEKVVTRSGFAVKDITTAGGACPRCGERIFGSGMP